MWSRCGEGNMERGEYGKRSEDTGVRGGMSRVTTLPRVLGTTPGSVRGTDSRVLYFKSLTQAIAPVLTLVQGYSLL